MDNKVLIQIIYISIPASFIGLLSFFIEIDKATWIAEIAGSVFLLTASYLLLKNGTLIKAREYRLMSLSISVLIFATMFKIMHWPYSAILFGIGFFSMIAIYSSHFIKKSVKSWIDIGKLIFLISFVTSKYITLMHWPYGDILTVFSGLLLMVITIGFIRNSKSLNTF
jgi:hypothetical protein